MAVADTKHWVEDLFPPSFALTLDDILKEKQIKTVKDGTVEDGEAEQTKEEESVFAKLARKVSPLDVDAIKNVYERVWVMTHLEEKERKRREEENGIDSSQTPRTTSDAHGYKKLRDAETSTFDINELAPLDVQDPCIWNSSEIDVLRTVFQAAKEQNSKLSAQILETQDHFEKLREKYKKQTIEHGSRSKHLQQATTANERLTILAKNLKQQIQSATKQIDRLKYQISAMDKERKDLMEQIHELRVTADRDRLERTKIELELQHQTQETMREIRVQEENLKLMHDEDIQFLQKTIEDLTEELKREKKDHERTKRGLNHLRQHFSSQSLIEEQTTEGSVQQNQLTKWTY